MTSFVDLYNVTPSVYTCMVMGIYNTPKLQITCPASSRIGDDCMMSCMSSKPRVNCKIFILNTLLSVNVVFYSRIIKLRRKVIWKHGHGLQSLWRAAMMELLPTAKTTRNVWEPQKNINTQSSWNINFGTTVL